MLLDLTTDELLSTTRSVRKRLDFERPVSRETLMECVELALQAPNSCNAQRWRFLVIEDAAIRMRLADLYRKGFEFYQRGDFRAGNLLIGDPAWDGAQARTETSVDYLAGHLHRAPVMVVPCIERAEREFTREDQAVLWGSVVPAVWSFCLAARSRGLGTSWTTLHLQFEDEAADILGVPYRSTQQVALLPVAYTKGTHFKPAYRLPAREVMTFYPP